VFLAVFLAVYLVREIDRFRDARERNRIYCRKKALWYTYRWRLGVVAKQPQAGNDLYSKQAKWWERQAKSWIPIHPTQNEQDMETEEPLDAEVRQAIKDLKDWERDRDLVSAPP
jgi:hypothetical protein